MHAYLVIDVYDGIVACTGHGGRVSRAGSVGRPGCGRGWRSGCDAAEGGREEHVLPTESKYRWRMVACLPMYAREVVGLEARYRDVGMEGNNGVYMGA